MSTTQNFGSAAMAAAMEIPAPPAQDPPMQQYRGAALNQPFDMRARMKASREKPMVGFWYGAFPDVGVARMVGQAGYDFVMIDWEHTPYSVATLVEIIKTVQYAGEGSTAVIVRVPSHEHQYIAWVLDAGASGVVLPNTKTVEQAKAAVAAARSPAYGGKRSIPPSALLWGYNDAPFMFPVWDRAAVIIQLESEEGALAADEIAAIDGVDCLMVGPGDLALSMGVDLTTMFTDPRFMRCVNAISDGAKKHGKASFMPSVVPKVDTAYAAGYTMATCGSDGVLFTKAIREALKVGHEQLDAWKQSQKAGKAI